MIADLFGWALGTTAREMAPSAAVEAHEKPPVHAVRFYSYKRDQATPTHLLGR